MENLISFMRNLIKKVMLNKLLVKNWKVVKKVDQKHYQLLLKHYQLNVKKKNIF